MEEIRTDNTETLENTLERIAELEKENAELKAQIEELKKYYEGFECVFDFKAFMKGGKH